MPNDTMNFGVDLLPITSETYNLGTSDKKWNIFGTLTGNATNVTGTVAVGHGGTNITSYTIGDILYASAATTLSKLGSNTTTTNKFLRSVATTSGTAAAPSWESVTKSDVGLSNVENTKLSTWTGSANIATVGTITSGTWSGTVIGADKGGTGQTTLKDSCNALINALDTGSSDLTANDYVITQYVGGGTTTTTYHRRPASKVINATLVKAALGTGSTADKFLRSDGNWSNVLGGAFISYSGSGVYHTSGDPTFCFLSYQSNNEAYRLGTIFMSSTAVNSKRVPVRMYFTQTSYNASTGALLSYREHYILPQVATGLTGNTTYNILTTKTYSPYLSLAHYNTTSTASTSNYILVKINVKIAWMLAFTLRVYKLYKYYDYVISGYNYGTNHWYSPAVEIIGSSEAILNTIKFGYYNDPVGSGNHCTLWVAVPADSYMGADIFNVTSAYHQLASYSDMTNAFELSYVSTLPGTTQTTLSVYPKGTTIFCGTGGTVMGSGTNIDTGILTPGTYYTASDADSQTISGVKPATGSGLKLITMTGYRDATKYQFAGNSSDEIFYRASQDTGSTWTNWFKVARIKSGDAVAGSGSGTYATWSAVGSTTKPVYVGSDGIIKQITMGNSGQFYRGDGTWTDTLSNSSGAQHLLVEGTAESYVRVCNTTTGCYVYLDSAGNGAHGLWSSGYGTSSSNYTSNGRWIIQRNSVGDTVLPVGVNSPQFVYGIFTSSSNAFTKKAYSQYNDTLKCIEFVFI